MLELIKRLKQQAIMEHHQKLFLVWSLAIVIVCKIISHQELAMKLVVRFMLNKTQLFKLGKIVVWELLCIFMGMILFVYFVKDL